VEGETLENLIKRSGRPEVKLALEIATQVAAGLAAVHKQNLVHRDIKPSNVMVSLEGGSAVTAKSQSGWCAKRAKSCPISLAFSRFSEIGGPGMNCWPKDRLRHSYGSSHLAKFRHAGNTAQNMGHRTTDMLYKHYRDVIKD
jgi:serine/threonine protein kinase